MQWTKEQEKVIRHRDGNLLVSAAAGSGKTAVLVEHVISLLTDPIDPVSFKELVIMTFTDAAAQEMRERIREALTKICEAHPGNERLYREAGSIQNASISTIDAFCKRLIMENYALLDLDPSFRIAEEGELTLLRSDLIKEIMEDRYQSGDEAFLQFVEGFARGKEDAGIEELILQIYAFAMARPWPEEYLSNSNLIDEANAIQYLLHRIYIHLKDLEKSLSLALEISESEEGPSEYLPALAEDREFISGLLFEDSIESLSQKLINYKFPRLKQSKSPYKSKVTAIRNSVKKEIQNLSKRLNMPEGEKLEEIREGVKQNVSLLFSLAREFLKRYQEAKTSQRMLDFSDLEHYALKLLYEGEGEGRRPSALADDYAKNIREILVDEYQDTNDVQEALVNALSKERFGHPNVFQVGDVKQSIYRFRLARPAIFMGKYSDPDYPKAELSSNFRSRKPILDVVNLLFSTLMRETVGGITYTEDVWLSPGRIDASEDYQKYLPELWIQSADKEADGNETEDKENEGKENEVNENDGREGKENRSKDNKVMGGNDSSWGADDEEEEDERKEDSETRLIAERIRLLIKEGYHYRDIVILLRSPGSWAERMIEILEEEGIPAYAVTSTGYFSAIEVETVLSFLSIIDNPRQSIPLAAVMRSPIYGFTDEELARIVISKGTLERTFPDEESYKNGEKISDEKSEDELHSEEELQKIQEPQESPYCISKELSDKLEAFYLSLRHFRELSRYLKTHELLYRIYEESGYYQYVSAMPAGERRRANLDQLIDSAIAFEKSSYKGLFDFIRYIEKLKLYKSDRGEASVYAEDEDLVRIMSIHRSKGLQFPVVFLSGLARRLNKSDLSSNVLMDPMLGVATDYIDKKERIRYPSLKKLAIRERLEAEQAGEELRLLYVAMTRAEDKLIMTSVVKDLDKLISKWEEADFVLSSSSIQKAGSMLDWILMAGILHDPSILVYKRYACDKSFKALIPEDSSRFKLDKFIEEMNSIPENDELRMIFNERFSYIYPYDEATRIFPKYSVSQIKTWEMPGDMAASMPIGDDSMGDLMKDSMRALVSDIRSREDISLEDFIALKNKPPAVKIGDAYHHALKLYDYERDFSQLAECLSKEEFSLISEKSFKIFLESPLGRSFKKGQCEGRLFREKHFMKQVPYNYLFPDSKNAEDVILQGIIDAFLIEDDGIVLVDYKTDRVKDEETLIKRYSLQLKLYGDALMEITGKPLLSSRIYSFYLGREIIIN